MNLGGETINLFLEIVGGLVHKKDLLTGGSAFKHIFEGEDLSRFLGSDGFSFLGSSSGSGTAFLEEFDTALDIEEALFTGVERVTVAADVDFEFGKSRSGDELVTTGTSNDGFGVVLGVSVLLHFSEYFTTNMGPTGSDLPVGQGGRLLVG